MQSKLFQEPPTTLDDALLVAWKFEAANGAMQTLGSETLATERFSKTKIAAINSMPTVKHIICTMNLDILQNNAQP